MRRSPALLYFHGGGWISGGMDEPRRDLRDARRARRLPGDRGRLSPRARASLSRRARGRRGGVARDRRRSAPLRRRSQPTGDRRRLGGANLAVVLARETPTPLALQLLLCPVMDPLGRTPSRAALASGWLIEEATMAAYWDFYRVPGLSPDDPRVAPLARRRFRPAAAGARPCRRIRSFARRGRGLRRGADPGRGPRRTDRPRRARSTISTASAASSPRRRRRSSASATG